MNMKEYTATIVASVIMTLLPLMVRAQTSQTEIKRKISSVAASIRSMECDFVQTKNIKMLDEKMVSAGKMYFSGGNKLRWEYSSPYTYTFILNDSKIVISNNSVSNVIDVNRSAMFKEIVRIMMNSVTGRCLTDEKEFAVTITESPSVWIAKMIPQGKEMKKLFKQINLSISRRKSMVTSVELVENSGDVTTIELKNIKTNTAINDKVFRVD